MFFMLFLEKSIYTIEYNWDEFYTEFDVNGTEVTLPNFGDFLKVFLKIWENWEKPKILDIF